MTIDAAYLTTVLRQAGVLTDGRVRDVIAEAPRDMILSRIIRLRLTYDGAADGAPSSLILKTALPHLPLTFGRHEVAFYQTVGPAMPAGLVPRSFDAAWSEEATGWHLLLEDLTDSHRTATIWPLPPTEAECRAIVAALARCHAAWWDDARLGASIGTWMDEAAAQQNLERIHGNYRTFVDRLGDSLSAERRSLYERYFAKPPRFRERYTSRRDITVVHNDAHVWNFFLPNDERQSTLLFDWDGWHLGLAASDLADMMALHWYPERRHRFEKPLLDHYHAALVAAGVTGYSRAALDEDYRLAVLMMIMRPVNHAALGIPPVIWWSHLERITAAVDDLGCRDLLD